MIKTIRLKPAVPKAVLLLLAGTAWFCAGSVLFRFAWRWLSAAHRPAGLLYGGLGVTAGLLIHRFGFQKIAAKNSHRILSLPERPCVFAFFTWKSYLLITVMAAMGTVLRHSALPRPDLGILYTAIGLALVLSSLKYIRTFIHHVKP